jgi:hypothetical protein
MQLKKFHWLNVRRRQPCMGCGLDHESRECVTRRGQLRWKLNRRKKVAQKEGAE